MEQNQLAQARAASVRRLAARLQLALAQVAELTKTITALALKRYAPLTAIVGVAPLTAGTLAAILGPGQRFTTEAQVAAFAGAAPLEASSAGRPHHRLNRGGNRQLNAILYRIALTQYRLATPGRAYIERSLARGRTFKDALRSLKRYIARAIFTAWIVCTGTTAPRASCACT